MQTDFTNWTVESYKTAMKNSASSEPFYTGKFDSEYPITFWQRLFDDGDIVRESTTGFNKTLASIALTQLMAEDEGHLDDYIYVAMFGGNTPQVADYVRTLAHQFTRYAGKPSKHINDDLAENILLTHATLLDYETPDFWIQIIESYPQYATVGFTGLRSSDVIMAREYLTRMRQLANTNPAYSKMEPECLDIILAKQETNAGKGHA